MQLKCAFCSMPYALSKEQVAEAIEAIKADATVHYDAHCPKCRRVTRINKKMLAVNPIYKKILESKE